MFLRHGFSAKGEVRLSVASMDVLECDGATLENEGGNALNADGLD